MSEREEPVTTMRQTAEAAYVVVLAEERVTEMSEADRRARVDAARQEAQQAHSMWAYLIRDHPDNPLHAWFPDEGWHLAATPEYGGQNWIVVCAESDMSDKTLQPNDRVYFKVITITDDHNTIAGVLLTTSNVDSDGWSRYWSGPDRDQDMFGNQNYLTGPADVGRYLADRSSHRHSVVH